MKASNDQRILVEWCEPNGTYLVSYRRAGEQWTHTEGSPGELEEMLAEAAAHLQAVPR